MSNSRTEKQKKLRIRLFLLDLKANKDELTLDINGRRKSNFWFCFKKKPILTTSWSSGKGFKLRWRNTYIFGISEKMHSTPKCTSKRFMSNATLEVTHSYHFSHLKAKRAKVTWKRIRRQHMILWRRKRLNAALKCDEALFSCLNKSHFPLFDNGPGKHSWRALFFFSLPEQRSY